MSKEQKLELGDEVKDMITGYQGIAIAYTKHITGCDRLTVQAPADKAKGTIPDAFNFDITTLTLIKKGVVKPVDREIEPLPEPKLKAGGPPTRAKRD